MIVRLLLALLGVIALIWFLRWFSRTPPRQISRRLKQGVLWLVAIILLVLALTGRLHWIFALLAPLLPAARRLLPLLRYVPLLNHFLKQRKAGRRARGGQTGQASQVETRFVRMTLDHDSGEIDGSILAGQYSGQSLSSLTQGELTELYRHYLRQDQESARLLQAFLDRKFGAAWHEQDQEQQRTAESPSGPMDRAEALAILGLDGPATEQEVIAAHRRLMQKLHPDRGGSDYLAAKINQAKDTLLET